MAERTRKIVEEFKTQEPERLIPSRNYPNEDVLRIKRPQIVRRVDQHGTTIITLE